MILGLEIPQELINIWTWCADTQSNRGCQLLGLIIPVLALSYCQMAMSFQKYQLQSRDIWMEAFTVRIVQYIEKLVVMV